MDPDRLQGVKRIDPVGAWLGSPIVRVCKRGSGSGVLGPSFMAMDLQVFFMIPGILELTSITPYIWGFAGGGLFSTLYSSARLS